MIEGMQKSFLNPKAECILPPSLRKPSNWWRRMYEAARRTMVVLSMCCSLIAREIGKTAPSFWNSSVSIRRRCCATFRCLEVNGFSVAAAFVAPTNKQLTEFSVDIWTVSEQLLYFFNHPKTHLQNIFSYLTFNWRWIIQRGIPGFHFP